MSVPFNFTWPSPTPHQVLLTLAILLAKKNASKVLPFPDGSSPENMLNILVKSTLSGKITERKRRRIRPAEQLMITKLKTLPFLFSHLK